MGYIPEDMPEGYVTLQEANTRLGRTPRGEQHLWLCAKGGRIPGAQQIAGYRGRLMWVVPWPCRIMPAVQKPENYRTTQDVANKLRLTRARVAQLCADGRFSGAFRVRGKWFIPWPAQIVSEESPQQRLVREASSTPAFRNLTAQERSVLDRRYGDTIQTMQDIADADGITRQRIHQIERAALEKLRAALEGTPRDGAVA